MNTEAMPKCPQCGAPLPPDAPDGLCPNCVMALNLKTETVFTDDSPAAQPPLPPEQIAPHFPQLEILECLGRGGMGVVYKARQKTLNRLVALKLLAPERVGDAKFAERFTREAQALAALNHPNIVTIYDFGQAGGFYYLLMEFVDGVNLRQLLRTRKFTPEEALAIVPPLCDALQFAHERGIVHRDIKPENLLLDKSGRVKVADFGIAKMLGNGDGGDSREKLPPETATQSALGTPGYSAPEQKSDPQRVDSRADIYSLGVVFYEMLTGELPGKKIEAPSKKIHIDVRIDEIVLRALEKTPELRWQTAADMRTRVETIVSGGGKPEPAGEGNLNRTRRDVTIWGFLLALGWAGVGFNTTNIGWLIVVLGGIAFLASAMLAWASDEAGKIQLAGQMVLTNGIMVCASLIWGAVNGLPFPSCIPAASACLMGIAFCLWRLIEAARTEAAAPRNLGWLAVACSAMGIGLLISLYALPTSWWLAGDIRIWMLPVIALLAVWFSGLARKKHLALPALICLMFWLAEFFNAQHTRPGVIGVVFTLLAMGVALALFPFLDSRYAAQAIPASLSHLPPAKEPSRKGLAGTALFLAGLGGVLGTVAFGVMPKTFPVLDGAIFLAALAGILLGVKTRETRLGKTAVVIGGINLGIGLLVMAVFNIHPEKQNAGLAGAQEASFGPVVELMLTNSPGQQPTLIGLDSGKVVTGTPDGVLPKNDSSLAPLGSVMAVIDWMRQARLDLAYGGELGDSVIGVDMKLKPLANADWAGMSAAQLQQTMEPAEPTPLQQSSLTLERTNFPATYAFETRAGGIGIFQYVDRIDKNEGPDYVKVKVRYKLVQGAQGGRPEPGRQATPDEIRNTSADEWFERIGDKEAALGYAPNTSGNALIEKAKESGTMKNYIIDKAGEIINDPQQTSFRRWQSCYVLSYIGDKRGISTIAQALQDKDKTVRGVAACALGEFDDANARDALQAAALTEKDPDVQAWIKKALDGQFRLKTH